MKKILIILFLIIISANYSYSQIPNPPTLLYPANGATNIRLEVRFKTAGHPEYSGLSVSIKIFDILGKEIQTLMNKKLNPGTYEATFDGSNLQSGIYFYQLKTGDFTETKKIILLK